MSTVLDAALEYALAGRFVFPLSPGTKIPPKGSSGFHDASAEAETVRQWWTSSPDANLAIATGLPSKVFVVDLDTDSEKGKDGMRVWAALEKSNSKAPDTYTVQTPRGGRHLYFSMPDEHPIHCGTDKLGPGIDIRGDGGYVVAPPSMVDGKPYRVLNAAPPAKPPPWLIKFLRKKSQQVQKTPPSVVTTGDCTPAPGANKIREALKFIPPENYDEWLKVGMALHKWSPEAGQQLWDEWSRQSEKYNPAAIEGKWRSFDAGNGNGSVTLGTLFHTAQQHGWINSSLPEIDNAAAMLADDTIMQPAELVEFLIHQGTKVVFGSNSKARKTWLLLDLALSVQAGVLFWKWKTRKGRVLYINFEIPRAFIRSRIRNLCEAKSISDASELDVWTLRGHAAPFWKLMPEILRRIQAKQYAMIVIDPVYKGLGGRDENSAGDTGELCNEMERLAVASGAAVVFAAHFSKGSQASKEAIDRISGSGVFGRDPDSIITLTKHEQEGAYTVDLILRNFPEQEPFVVKWDFPLMVAADLNPEDLKQPTGRKKQHSTDTLLDLLADQSLSSTEWAKLAKNEEGIGNGTFYELLKELRKSKRITLSVINRKWVKA